MFIHITPGTSPRPFPLDVNDTIEVDRTDDGVYIIRSYTHLGTSLMRKPLGLAEFAERYRRDKVDVEALRAFFDHKFAKVC